MPGVVVTRETMDPLAQDDYARPTHGKGKKRKRGKKKGAANSVNKSSKIAAYMKKGAVTKY